jgi:hypothetical protein
LLEALPETVFFVALFFRFAFAINEIKAGSAGGEKRDSDATVEPSTSCVRGRPQRASIEVATDNSPEGEPLQTTSFAIHATRGILRDQKTRRRVMVIVLTSALVLMIAGVTFLKTFLDPHEHPWWFIFFWLVCAWLTVTAILLSIFDLLMVGKGARDAQRQLRDQMQKQSPTSNQ